MRRRRAAAGTRRRLPGRDDMGRGGGTSPRSSCPWRVGRGCVPRRGPARAGHAAACPPRPRCGPGGLADVLADLARQILLVSRSAGTQRDRCRGADVRGGRVSVTQLVEQVQRRVDQCLPPGSLPRRTVGPRGFRCSVMGSSSLTPHPLADHLVARELGAVQLLVPAADGE